MCDATHRPMRHHELSLSLYIYVSLFLSREISFFTGSSARRTHINRAMHVREIALGASAREPPFTFVARFSVFYWGGEGGVRERVHA